MANKIINIQSNELVEKKDFNTGYSYGNQSSTKYVYMDVNIDSGYMKYIMSDLSSINQYNEVLGTESIKRASSIKYPIVESSNGELFKIFLDSRSTLKITKRIDDLVKQLRNSNLDHSRIKNEVVDGHTIKTYIY